MDLSRSEVDSYRSPRVFSMPSSNQAGKKDEEQVREEGKKGQVERTIEM